MSKMTTTFVQDNYDTLLLCDHVLLFEKQKAIVKANQAIAVKTGKIVTIGHWGSAFKQYIGTKYQAFKTGMWKVQVASHLAKNSHPKRIYYFKNHLVCPGFVNTHTHLPMSLFRSLAEDLPLKAWLENYIFPLENKFITRDAIDAGTMLSAAELIRSGITTVFDMYFHTLTLAKALDRAGLRALLGVGIPDVKNTNKKNKLRFWKERVKALKTIYKNHKRLQVALAPHAPYTVRPQELKAIGEFARSENVAISIHVAETKWEMQEIRRKYNKTPVEHLHHLGITGRKSLFVHCVHLTKKDMQILKKTNTAISYNPESNMKLSSGIAPISTAWEEGIKIGLGTDGAASNNNLNFFGEMNTGIKLQKLQYPKGIKASDMFYIATMGGAQALNLENKIGSLAIGKYADIIAINLHYPHLYPKHHLVSHLVHSAHGGEVDFVMCHGKVLMENGEIKIFKEDDVYEKTNHIAKQMQQFLNRRLR